MLTYRKLWFFFYFIFSVVFCLLFLFFFIFLFLVLEIERSDTLLLISIPSPIYLSIYLFSDRVLLIWMRILVNCEGWPQICDFPALASWGITSVCHCALIYFQILMFIYSFLFSKVYLVFIPCSGYRVIKYVTQC